jgi:hypothetical protein
MNAAGGFIPLVGGLLSAAAGYWGEREQQQVNDFIQGYIQMLRDEMKEKAQVLTGIIARLDMHDEAINERIRSDEYQSIMRKAFRNWAGAESVQKREYIRNLLSNAAAAKVVSDDVVKLFLDWLQTYSELHFAVIAYIFNNPECTRAEIWDAVGSGPCSDDSAEADLFRLLIHDLSVGRVVRQERETDSDGRFLRTPRPKQRGRAPTTMTSAFEDEKPYVLTALGSQFVSYAMTEVPMKIVFREDESAEGAESNVAQ